MGCFSKKYDVVCIGGAAPSRKAIETLTPARNPRSLAGVEEAREIGAIIFRTPLGRIMMVWSAPT